MARPVKRPWTAEEWTEAKLLRLQGKSYGAIGAVLGRTQFQVANAFLRARERAAGPALTVAQLGLLDRASAARPAPPVLIERDRRLSIAPRDLTAAICGDPPVGYSALERRAAGRVPKKSDPLDALIFRRVAA